MIYREAAFDHFDTVFCVGSHHEREIKATEEKYGLLAKALIKHGYPRLDTIIEEIRHEPAIPASGSPNPPRTFLGTQRNSRNVRRSPDWSIARRGLPRDGTPAPHDSKALWPPTRRPEQTVHTRKLRLRGRCRQHRMLRRSNLMISDWSGAALEYAFSRETPVLFIDVPRKINNPNWQDINIEPIEASIRTGIGTVLAADRLSEAPDYVADLIERKEEYLTRIRTVRDRCVFNLGQCRSRGGPSCRVSQTQRLITRPRVALSAYWRFGI